MSPLRVILAAENASTRMGGEAILPFHYFRILRTRNIDAWLVVHERNRTELTALFPHDLERIFFIKDQALQKLFFRVMRLLPRRIAEATFGLANHLLTQFAQRSILRSLATQRSVVHQPTPVSPRFPSLLWNLGSPLIVGPLNGGMEYPKAFRKSESPLSRVAIALGRSLSKGINALLPGKRRAAVLLVANERTRAALPSHLQGRIVLLPENAVDLTHWQPASAAQPAPVQPPPDAPFLFLGRLVDWKALDLALEALARTPGARLEVIGDGPMLPTWRSLAEALGLTGRVHFHGWLPQQECALHLQRARALLLPSLYECGGAVVLEAMATAKPVIATAWGGPADYLDPTCGILLEPTSREALISGFAQAMAGLLASPETCLTLGTNGRAKIEHSYDWEKKVDTLLLLYHSVLPPAS